MTATMTKERPDARTHPGIDRAIERAGGIVAFCRQMDVSHQAVYDWKRRGWAPPARAKRMEDLFGVPASDTMDPKLAALFGDDGDKGRGLI